MAKEETEKQEEQEQQPAEVQPEAESTAEPQAVAAAEEATPAEPAPAEAEAEKEEKPKKEKEPERQDITTLHERTIATLSYFGFLAVVPFYLKKDSEFCRFHGKQGMLLAIMFFLAKLMTVIDLIFDLVLILQVVMMFMMGFAALSGRWKKLPFFYDWACELESALTLKTKEQEQEEPGLKPREMPGQEEEQEAQKSK